MNAAVQQKVWDKASIIDLLETNDAAVIRALKSIYARQTADEQRTNDTRHRNGIGFTGADAPILSDIAQRLPRYNDHLTPKQLRLVRAKLRKYWRQLLEEVEAKGGQVSYREPAKRPISEAADQPFSEEVDTPIVEPAHSPRPTLEPERDEIWGSW